MRRRLSSLWMVIDRSPCDEASQVGRSSTVGRGSVRAKDDAPTPFSKDREKRRQNRKSGHHEKVCRHERHDNATATFSE